MCVPKELQALGFTFLDPGLASLKKAIDVFVSLLFHLEATFFVIVSVKIMSSIFTDGRSYLYIL